MNKHNEQLNSLWHQGDIELCPGTQNISPNVQSWWQDELLKGVFYSKKCNAAKVIHGFYDHLRWSETDLRVRENKTAVERNMSTGITFFFNWPWKQGSAFKDWLFFCDTTQKLHLPSTEPRPECEQPYMQNVFLKVSGPKEEYIDPVKNKWECC